MTDQHGRIANQCCVTIVLLCVCRGVCRVSAGGPCNIGLHVYIYIYIYIYTHVSRKRQQEGRYQQLPPTSLLYIRIHGVYEKYIYIYSSIYLYRHLSHKYSITFLNSKRKVILSLEMYLSICKSARPWLGLRR